MEGGKGAGVSRRIVTHAIEEYGASFLRATGWRPTFNVGGTLGTTTTPATGQRTNTATIKVKTRWRHFEVPSVARHKCQCKSFCWSRRVLSSNQWITHDRNIRIKTDGGTQPRVLNQETVAEYREAYKAGIKMPPVTLFLTAQITGWLMDSPLWAAKKPV